MHKTILSLLWLNVPSKLSIRGSIFFWLTNGSIDTRTKFKLLWKAIITHITERLVLRLRVPTMKQLYDGERTGQRIILSLKWRRPFQNLLDSKMVIKSDSHFLEIDFPVNMMEGGRVIYSAFLSGFYVAVSKKNVKTGDLWNVEKIIKTKRKGRYKTILLNGFTNPKSLGWMHLICLSSE